MKRYIKNIAALLLAASVCGCSEFEELDNNAGGYIPAPGETIKLVLNADKGEADVTPETRVFVGKTEGGKVTYYWNDGDQIGVIPMNIVSNSVKPNYVTEEVQIYSDNQNQAQFASYITGDDYKGATPHLLIYYPYSASMLEYASGTDGKEFAKNGLRFRLPQYQEQYGYSRAYIGSDPEDKDVNEHPSVWAVSNYGLAYDLASCFIDKSIGEGHTDVTATGDFKLDHANTYFQFNVFGSHTEGGKDYADGSWKVASVSVEAGNCNIGTDDDGETIYTLSDKIALAGTYTFKYEYQSSHFDNDATAKYGNNDNIKLSPVANATVTSVKVNMNNVAEAPFLKNNAKQGVPVFAVINALDIKKNPNGNLNCLKVAVMCYKYDDEGNVLSSDTRTRYYNIESIVGSDISGNFYSIDFEVCDPVESYSDLSVTNTANCYLINAPGNYSFNANIAGNGQVPFDGETLGIDPTNLLQDDKTYAIDWLWASGQSFDAVKSANSSFSDAQIVESILEDVQLSGKTGHISIKFADDNSAQALSGNIVLALYETDENGTVGDIVWTWHLWLGSPSTHHYKFPGTNTNWKYTNEDWYMMDRNLGAETNELNNPRSTGLFYQRSRKEPMISWGDPQGSATWTSNQLPTYRNTNVFGDRAQWTANKSYSSYNTLKYPMALITGYRPDQSTSEYYYGWSHVQSDVNDTSNNTKSMFDPCPAGYRMPTVREWDNLKADPYRAVAGAEGWGVFGYCPWKELAIAISSANASDERNIELLSHIAGGDYYTIHEGMEREYHITHFSGTGKEIVTRFPNTGVLNGKGQWQGIYDDSTIGTITTTTVTAGPVISNATVTSTTSTTTTTISAPQITNNNNGGTINYSSSRFSVTLNSSAIYYYKIGESGNIQTIRSSNISNFRIYPTTGTSSSTAYINNIFSSNAANGSTQTIYLYRKEGDVYSEATTITITKSSTSYSTSYSATYKNGGSTTVSEDTIKYILNVEFAESGSYSYAYSDGGSKTSFNGASRTFECADLTYNEARQATIYFYKGTNSAATTVTVTRSINQPYSYSVGAIVQGEAGTKVTGGGEYTEGSNVAISALWTSGRIDGNNFATYWFGVGENVDPWSTSLNGSTAWNTGSPYTMDRRTYGFCYNPYKVGSYTSYSTTSNYYEPAAPTRCIREYDNTSTATVAE